MSGSKVVRYKRRPRAVAFIFALVLIYIICFVVLYISKSKAYKGALIGLSDRKVSQNGEYQALINGRMI